MILNEAQQWLIDFGRSFLLEQAQKQRAGLSQVQQALLQQQIEWRRRSRFRFPQPDLWLWSDRSLSQSSDWLSACFKASLVPPSVLAIDGCCGAGVDAVALALRGSVIAVDEDPWMTALAKSNAASHGQQIQSYAEPLTKASLREAHWMHADPDRRPGNVKTLEADEFTPAIEQFVEMLEGLDGGIIKIAPATRLSPDMTDWVSEHCTRVWMGSFGECRQQLLLYGQARVSECLRSIFAQSLPQESTLREFPADKPGVRMAAVLCPTDSASASSFKYMHRAASPMASFRGELFARAEENVEEVDVDEEVGEYVYDLHAVLHASELHESWAAERELTAITDSRGYFTSDHAIDSPMAQCFQVVEVVSMDDRKLRKWLRSQNVGNVEIKCRLHTLDASALQRRYSSDQGDPMTLLVTRFGDRVRAIACRRV